MKYAQRKWQTLEANRKKHNRRYKDWEQRWLTENTENMKEVTGRVYNNYRSGQAALQRELEPKKYLLRRAKDNARSAGVGCDLILSDIVIPDVCPVLQIPLFFTTGSATDNTPSIDRIIPSKSYNKNNILIMSQRANRIKNDGTPDEHRKIYEYFNGYK
jgi:hypothetical protein